MPLRLPDIPDLEGNAQDWVITRAEQRLDEQSTLVKAQDRRAVMMLTTAVVLSTLAALVAAIALAVPRNTTSVLVASISALAGFSTSAGLVLLSVRSEHFHISGAPPSEALGKDLGLDSLDALRKVRIVELEGCLLKNGRMLEGRRRLGNWALWTLMATPLVSLLYGWLASQ